MKLPKHFKHINPHLDLSRYAQRCGWVTTNSESTIWRWLNQDSFR